MLFDTTHLFENAASPVVAIGGVFVPAWILCAIGAVVAAMIIRALLVALAGGPIPGLGAPFYAALAVLIGLGAYLFRIGGF